MADNPYKSPATCEDTSIREKSAVEAPHVFLTSCVAVAVSFYTALTVALIFGDSSVDTIMGALFLCNCPMLALWLSATSNGRPKAVLFGWYALVIQFAIGWIQWLSIGLPEQTLMINGIMCGVILAFTIAIQRRQNSILSKTS